MPPEPRIADRSTATRTGAAPQTWWRRCAPDAYVGLVIVGGLAAIADSATIDPITDVGLLGLLVGLCALAQLLRIPLVGQTSVSLAFAITYAGLLLLGPSDGMVVNLGSIAVYALYPTPRPLYKVLFTAGSFALSTQAGAFSYLALGGTFPPRDTLLMVPAALTGALAYYLVNTWSVAVAIALAERRPLLATWRSNYLWLSLQYVIMAGISLVMSGSFLSVGIAGLLAFTVPLILPWYSIRIFMARTREVQERNEQLARANVELESANATLTQRVHELRALHAIGLTLNSSLNRETVLAQITAAAAELTGAHVAAIYLAEGERGALRIADQHGLSPSYLQQPEPSLDGAAERAMREGRRLVVDGRNGSPDMLSGAAVQEGVVAAVCLPLRVANESLGLVDIAFRTPHTFGEEELRLLETLAEQAAVAIHNARLVAQVGEAEAVRELSRLKSEFLSTVSHELRTPLTALVGYSELLAQVDFPPERMRQMATHLHREALRMTTLVTDLLDISRIETGRLHLEQQEVCLGELVTEAVERFTFSSTIHRLDVALAPGLPPVVADPNRVAQVLNNLLSNAIRYSPGGGTVRVVAARASSALFNPSGDLRGPSASLDGLAGDGWVEVSVSDEGIGIPADKLGRIFEKFYRVENELTRRIRGSGIGLSVCQYLIEAQGGRIWVESVEGQGSTFRFVLPCLSPTADQLGETMLPLLQSQPVFSPGQRG